MNKVKEHPFYILVTGFIFGFIFFSWISDLNINDISDKFKKTSSKYIEKNEIYNYLDKKNLIAITKDSYILKENIEQKFKDYVKKEQLVIISKDFLDNVKSLNNRYKEELNKANNNIQNLHKKLQNLPTSNNKKTIYLDDLEELITPEIYFVEKSTKIDKESMNKFKKLTDLNLDNNIQIRIATCKNHIESYNSLVAHERFKIVYKLLKDININPRKILYDENEILNPTCTDDNSLKIKDENDNKLAMGIALFFENSH